MSAVEEMQALYTAYLAEAAEVEAHARPWDGILGFGARPADHPCHTRFVEQLVQKTRQFRDDGISAEEAARLVEKICHEPLEHRTPASVYWTLIAAQGAALDLIPRMDPADRAGLCARFQQDYPRSERLPVQKYVLKALKA